MKRIPVIIDTDIGSDIDDTWSLAAMLGDDTFDIRLISTSDVDSHDFRAVITRGLPEPLSRGTRRRAR